MTRNANCSIIFCFLVNNWLHFPKEASSQIPYLYNRISLIRASKISYSTYKCTQMHTRLAQWHPKFIPNTVKHDLYSQSLHLTYICIRFRHDFHNWPFWSHRNHCTPCIVQQLWSFTVFRFSERKIWDLSQRKCMLLEGNGIFISHMVHILGYLQSSVGKS